MNLVSASFFSRVYVPVCYYARTGHARCEAKATDDRCECSEGAWL